MANDPWRRPAPTHLATTPTSSEAAADAVSGISRQGPESIATIVEIIEMQAIKPPALAAKQARLLEILSIKSVK